MNDREQKIHERAHALWEQEGRPEGRHLDHWERARKEIDERSESDGALSNTEESPEASVGAATGLHPSGTAPGAGAGEGSLGTGGGSTGGAATGSRAQSRK